MTHSKYKRLLAGLLSVVMTCSMFAPAVNAAPAEPAAAPAAGETTAQTGKEIPSNDYINVHAGSEERVEGKDYAANALVYEGLWHSRWHNDPIGNNNHWIALTPVPDKYVITGLTYLPRQDSPQSGMIKNYEIQGRNSGQTDWTTITSGTWNADKQRKTVTFDQQYDEYRLWSKKSNDGHTAAQEVRLLGYIKDPTKYPIIYRPLVNGPNSKMYQTAKASSYENASSGNDGPGNAAFDGSNCRGWHSHYSDGKFGQFPFTIEWQVGDTAIKVGKLGYIRSTSASNGLWRDIKVEGKNGESGTWETLAEMTNMDTVVNKDQYTGTNQNRQNPCTAENTNKFSNREVEIPFTKAMEVTHLKVTVKKAYSDGHNDGDYNFASAGEIITYECLPEISGVSVNLGNSLALRFGIDKTLLPADTNGVTATITRTYNDNPHKDPNAAWEKIKVEDVPIDKWGTITTPSGTEMHSVEYDGIAAKEMMDNVMVQIFDANGNALSAPYTSSVKDYATTVLGMSSEDLMKITNGKNPDKLKTVVTDMLNYGAEAQKFFGYNEQNLVNKDIDQSLATQTITPSVALQDNYHGTSLTLESNILMNVYFKKNAEANAPQSATVSYQHHNGGEIVNDSAKIETYQNDPSMYSVTVDGLAVADYKQDVTITVTCADNSTITQTTSMNDYLTKAVEQSNKPIYPALQKFAQSSLAYFTN